MKLETKIGLCTGGLIVAMLATALTAQVRIGDSNRLSARIMSERWPLVTRLRDLGSYLGQSVRATESSLLLAHGQPASKYATQRVAKMQAANEMLHTVQSQSELLEASADEESLRQAGEAVARMEAIEEQIARLNESAKTEDAERATRAFEDQLLPLYEAISTKIGGIADSQTRRAEDDVIRLSRANTLTSLSLWVATLLSCGAALLVSILLGRHLVAMIDRVAQRADGISGGDLTGDELSIGGNDQIGMLAEAMNRMQQSLRGIIGTVADTAGSLTGSAASMPRRPARTTG